MATLEDELAITTAERDLSRRRVRWLLVFAAMQSAMFALLTLAR